VSQTRSPFLWPEWREKALPALGRAVHSRQTNDLAGGLLFRAGRVKPAVRRGTLCSALPSMRVLEDYRRA
jgi:hypothetical protein